MRPRSDIELFDYGARCAEMGRLWNTMDETMANVAATFNAARNRVRLDMGL